MKIGRPTTVGCVVPLTRPTGDLIHTHHERLASYSSQSTVIVEPLQIVRSTTAVRGEWCLLTRPTYDMIRTYHESVPALEVKLCRGLFRSGGNPTCRHRFSKGDRQEVVQPQLAKERVPCYFLAREDFSANESGITRLGHCGNGGDAQGLAVS